MDCRITARSESTSFYKKNDKQFTKETDFTRRFEATFGVMVSLTETAIKDTIFHRPPLFFSLFIILDSIKNKISTPDLEEAIADMDARFNDENNQSRADTDFYVACTSNPH